MKKMPVFSEPDKVIYKTTSFCSLLLLLIGRLLIIFIIGSGLIHFNENPIVISIVLLVLGFILVWAGDTSLVVYEDRLVHQSNSWLKRFTAQRVYYYKDIKDVKCEGLYSIAFDKLTDLAPINIGDPWNRVTIIYKDGSTEDIETKIYKDKLREAVRHINEQRHTYKKVPRT